MSGGAKRTPAELPDPRPQVVDRGGARLVGGFRCGSCGYPIALPALLRCPRCGSSDVAPAEFGPLGSVWASTVVHLSAPGRPCPYTLAYVDVDDGPRVLGHVPSPPGPGRLAAGTRVRVAAPSSARDLCFEVVE